MKYTDCLNCEFHDYYTEQDIDDFFISKKEICVKDVVFIYKKIEIRNHTKHIIDCPLDRG